MEIEDNIEELVNVLEKELRRAFDEVDCDIRCFDWINFSPMPL